MRIIDADKLMQRIKKKLCISSFAYLLDSEKAIISVIESEPRFEMPTWIPCSERLPERDGDYLVTFHHKWPGREYKTVEVEEFRNGGFDENLYMKVIAWMPLPEPYKESK